MRPPFPPDFITTSNRKGQVLQRRIGRQPAVQELISSVKTPLVFFFLGMFVTDRRWSSRFTWSHDKRKTRSNITGEHSSKSEPNIARKHRGMHVFGSIVGIWYGMAPEIVTFEVAILWSSQKR